MRASRGKRSPPGLFGREAMAALLPARCQDLASTRAFHPCAETVRLAAAAHARLKGTLRQSNLPPAAFAAPVEVISLDNATRRVKKPRAQGLSAARPQNLTNARGYGRAASD